MKTLIAKLISVANILDERGYHKDANNITRLAYDFANPIKQDRVDDSLAIDIDNPDMNMDDIDTDEYQLETEEMPEESMQPETDEDKELKIIKDFINLIKGNDVEETAEMIENEVKPEAEEMPEMPEAPIQDMPQQDLSQEYSAAPQDIFAPKLSASMKKTILAQFKDLGL